MCQVTWRIHTIHQKKIEKMHLCICMRDEDLLYFCETWWKYASPMCIWRGMMNWISHMHMCDAYFYYVLHMERWAYGWCAYGEIFMMCIWRDIHDVHMERYSWCAYGEIFMMCIWRDIHHTHTCEQGGKDTWDALSSQIISRKKAL